MTTPVPQAFGRSRRPWFIAGGIALALIAIIGSVLLFRSPPPPRLNSDTLTIARFVAGKDYARLPVEKQSPYMQILEDREDAGELKYLLDSGQLSETEYRAAQLEAWLGEQMKRSEKYASLLAGRAREAYIQSLLDKKQKKKAGASAGSGKPANAAKTSVAGRIRRDTAAEAMRIAAWPADLRSRWEAHDRAYSEARQTRSQARAAAQGSKDPTDLE